MGCDVRLDSPKSAVLVSASRMSHSLAVASRWLASLCSAPLKACALVAVSVVASAYRPLPVRRRPYSCPSVETIGAMVPWIVLEQRALSPESVALRLLSRSIVLGFPRQPVRQKTCDYASWITDAHFVSLVSRPPCGYRLVNAFAHLDSPISWPPCGCLPGGLSRLASASPILTLASALRWIASACLDSPLRGSPCGYRLVDCFCSSRLTNESAALRLPSRWPASTCLRTPRIVTACLGSPVKLLPPGHCLSGLPWLASAPGKPSPRPHSP